MLPGFSCKDLVAVLVKYIEDGAEGRLVVCCAYLPYDSEDPHTSKEFEKLVGYCENKNPMHIIVHGVAQTNGRGEALVQFLNSSNLEMLNRGNEPTFCSRHRLEVIDINLGSFGLLEIIASWEVSLEPSLSGQTYSVHSSRHQLGLLLRVH
jgi:hypothetical protein